jgi:uncharacterized protein (DUF433 family)
LPAKTKFNNFCKQVITKAFGRGTVSLLLIIFTNMVNYKDYIERRPDVMLGKPLIKGTRITVELIMRKFAGGYTLDQLLVAYPQLNRDQISAAFEYAADIIANEEYFEAA